MVWCGVVWCGVRRKEEKDRRRKRSTNKNRTFARG